MPKTVIFEEKYGVDIKDFSTTKEIDEVIEKKIGRKLKVLKLGHSTLVPGRGNVFKLRKYDIKRRFDDTIDR